MYILYSQSIDRFYIGSCLDIDARLQEHLTGKHHNAFTKKATDWIVYFQINELNQQDARILEKHVKSMKSRKYIENLKSFPEMKSKLLSLVTRAGSSR